MDMSTKTQKQQVRDAHLSFEEGQGVARSLPLAQLRHLLDQATVGEDVPLQGNCKIRSVMSRARRKFLIRG